MTGNKITISRPPFWATLCTIIGIIILCSLGTWQIHRLEWKTQILETLDGEYAKDTFDKYLTAEDLTPEFNFKRGNVIGTFIHEQEIPISPRTLKGMPGYHIFTPIVLNSGETLLINRGWVPLALKDPSTRPDSLPRGPIEITALIRAPQKSNMFIPENEPQNNNWYRLDLEQIAQEKNITNLLPVTLYAESSPNDAEYPVAAATKPRIKNNHFQYACFWFAMAVIMGIIYMLRFVLKKQTDPSRTPKIKA